ncbi:universal stress protein [Methylomonas sp. AM2-LC]|uniref:universal stress protein n=1 Tax=Methylomonas sp. AM2-LC TaxID=3153301 RepID=UPI003263798A
MSLYTHILIAADFSDHGHEVSHVAKQLAEQNQAKLSVIHVFENIPIAEPLYAPMTFDADIAEELMKNAQIGLRKFADDLSVPEERQWFELGSPKLEIVRVAEENQVDLIVVGSHGRHGLGLLLGSTANGVLHHAKCDVLAVRLKDD